MPGHAEVERDLLQRVPSIVLHAHDIVVLVEAVTVVDEYGHDRNSEHQRQKHRHHDFDERESGLRFHVEVLHCAPLRNLDRCRWESRRPAELVLRTVVAAGGAAGIRDVRRNRRRATPDDRYRVDAGTTRARAGHTERRQNEPAGADPAVRLEVAIEDLLPEPEIVHGFLHRIAVVAVAAVRHGFRAAAPPPSPVPRRRYRWRRRWYACPRAGHWQPARRSCAAPPRNLPAWKPSADRQSRAGRC